MYWCIFKIFISKTNIGQKTNTIIDAMDEILEYTKPLKNICDNGSEFILTEFKKLLKKI